MTDATDSFPSDVEELPDDHQFYQDLADLVEEHEDSDLDREQLLYACISFGEYWTNQLHMTDSTW